MSETLFQRFAFLVENQLWYIRGENYGEKIETLALAISKPSMLLRNEYLRKIRCFVYEIARRLHDFEKEKVRIWSQYLTFSLNEEEKTISVGDEQVSVLVCDLRTLSIRRRAGQEKVNPCFIPLYLYVNWCSLEKILKGNSLKASEPRKCNDIYEFMPAWGDDEMKNNILKYCENLEQIMLCLSRTPNSSVMWGHYGDFSKGALLCFSIPVYRLICGETPNETLLVVANNEEEVKSGIKRKKSILITDVSYMNKRPVYKPTSNYYYYTRFASTKGVDWSYEREMRIIFNKDEYMTECIGDRYFTPIIMPYLNCAILGANCTHGVDEVNTMIDKWYKKTRYQRKVDVKKAAYSSTDYTLIVPATECPEICDIPLSRFYLLGV